MPHVPLTLLPGESAPFSEVAQGSLRPPVHPGQWLGLWLYFVLLPWGTGNTGFGIPNPEFATCCSHLCPGWMWPQAGHPFWSQFPHLQNGMRTSKAPPSPRSLSSSGFKGRVIVAAHPQRSVAMV